MFIIKENDCFRAEINVRIIENSPKNYRKNYFFIVRLLWCENSIVTDISISTSSLTYRQSHSLVLLCLFNEDYLSAGGAVPGNPGAPS